MTEENDLRSRLVIGQKRDGRREYDDEARDELIRLCLKRGVSIARTAMEHDINPNLLRTWVTQYRQRQAATESVAKVSEVSDEVMIDIAVPAALRCRTTITLRHLLRSPMRRRHHRLRHPR